MTINSSYITLHLSAWKSSSCPINNFVIQYKQQGSNEWILSSNTLNPLLETYTLSDLYSGTWYNLLIGAHSEAGSTEAEYLFATLTEAGATVSPLSASSASQDVTDSAAAIRLKRYIHMFLPVICIFVAFVVILVLLLLVSFRRGATRHMPGMQHFSESTSFARSSVHPFSRISGRIFSANTSLPQSCLFVKVILCVCWHLLLRRIRRHDCQPSVPSPLPFESLYEATSCAHPFS